MGNLGVSHYWGRRHESTRFDLDNCTLLCNIPCHQEWEHEKGDDKNGEPKEYKKYMLDRLGQEGFDLLELRAHTYQKKDDELIIMWLKQEIKNFENL